VNYFTESAMATPNAFFVSEREAVPNEKAAS
jgi:hypothetical protein